MTESIKNDNVLLFIKALVIAFLLTVSCDYFRLILAKNEINHAILYFSTFVIVPFGFVRYLLCSKKTNLIEVFLIAFIVWLTIRYYTTDYKESIYALMPLVNFITGLLAFFWIAPVVVKFKLERFTFYSFLIIAFFVALIGNLHTALLGIPSDGETSILNPHHAHIGLYMVVALGVASHLYHQATTKHEKLFIAFVSAMSFISIAISGSRAATLSLLIIALVWILGKSNMYVRLAASLFILIGAFAFLEQMAARAAVANTMELSNGVEVDTSVGYRFFIWYGLIELISTNDIVFWFGTGFESLINVYNKFIYFPIHVSGAHNLYIHVWAELGLIGFILYFTPIFLIMARLFKRRKNIGLHMLAMIIAVLASAFVQESLYANLSMGNFNVLFWGITGIVVHAGDDLNDDRTN